MLADPRLMGVTPVGVDDEDAQEYKGDAAAMRRGLEVMAAQVPRHFDDFMAENDDAITAYVWLQCCCLGEVVYG